MALILLVDDDPDVAAVCRLLLEKQGHAVIAAANRDEGMRLLEHAGPDLIILDVMMDQPDDGIAMAREIRRTAGSVPILMLTAMCAVSGMDVATDAEIVPVDAFVRKPVEASRLITKVEILLGR